MAKLHQGDALLLPVKIKMGQSYLTPLDVDDVRIQVGDNLRSYSAGELTYENNTFFFPLSEAETRKYNKSTAEVQVGIKEGTTITYSDVQNIDVFKSIIVKEW